MKAATGFANRVFEREGWARERLIAHAGRVFVVVIGPVATAMRIDERGQFESTALAGHPPDLTLTVSPLVLPSLLAQPTRWSEFVTAEGDTALAGTLQELAGTLPWFVEQAFASALGPIIGQRVADAGRRLLAFPEYAATRVGASVASYARDEAGLLARGDEMRMLASETNGLAARIETLTTRLDALATRLGPAVPRNAGGRVDASAGPGSTPQLDSTPGLDRTT